MFTDAFQQAGVQDRTLSLLNRWCENKLKSFIKPAYTPQEAMKYVFTNFINQRGQACYRVEILEGIDFVRSTAPRKHNDVDEVTYAFYSLSEQDQLLILSWVDPLSEVNSTKEWVEYLKSQGIRKNHQNLLIEALLNFQFHLQERGLVKMSENNDTLRGWSQIATYLDMSIPSAMQLAKTSRLPCSLVGGTVVTTKRKLDAWLDLQIDLFPYHKQKEAKKGHI